MNGNPAPSGDNHLDELGSPDKARAFYGDRAKSYDTDLERDGYLAPARLALTLTSFATVDGIDLSSGMQAEVIVLCKP